MKKKIKDLTIKDFKNICDMNVICNKCPLHNLCYQIYDIQQGLKKVDSETLLKEINL